MFLLSDSNVNQVKLRLRCLSFFISNIKSTKLQLNPGVTITKPNFITCIRGACVVLHLKEMTCCSVAHLVHWQCGSAVWLRQRCTCVLLSSPSTVFLWFRQKAPSWQLCAVWTTCPHLLLDITGSWVRQSQKTYKIETMVTWNNSSCDYVHSHRTGPFFLSRWVQAEQSSSLSHILSHSIGPWVQQFFSDAEAEQWWV